LVVAILGSGAYLVLGVGSGWKRRQVAAPQSSGQLATAELAAVEAELAEMRRD
jgi:hypothetical protein